MSRSATAEVVFEPSPHAVESSRMALFRRHCESATGLRFADHDAFHRWSVTSFRAFWRLFLEWSDLVVEGSLEPVCLGDDVETAQFFPDVRLSYVENLLRLVPDAEDDVALVGHHEDRPAERLTRRELREQVRAVAHALQRRGLRPGDRVVAVSGNTVELVVAGLAVMAVGATLSVTAPDLGASATLERFGQLEPSLLLYGVDASPLLPQEQRVPRLHELLAGLLTVRDVLLLDRLAVPGELDVPVAVLDDLRLAMPDRDPTSWEWPRFGFSQPLWVLFTSGTTGPPKCLVHTAGGALLEHAKEHVLHCDLGAEDVLFFATSPAWMMWNWELSALATGATVVLHDGPVVHPAALWSVVAEERVTVFGTGPAYLGLCRSLDHRPAECHDLSSLRSVLSTGSVLHDHLFDWVRDHVGQLPLQSISGGTDIVGCFFLGNPTLPVRRGELQGPSLALDVRAVPEPVEQPAAITAAVGELTCWNPFPSRPAGLLNDPDGQRFHQAYFSAHPGAWTHGDLVEITPTGSARLHGRSDSVMNVNGIRVAPAEIYRPLSGLPEIAQCLAVEQQTPDRATASRLVLLVVMAEGQHLDPALQVRIRQVVARAASSAHVPDLVVEVPELPRTHSGKDSERAAREAVSGVSVGNRSALRNPECLEAIRTAVVEADRRLGQWHRDEHLDSGGDDLVADLAAVFSMVLDVPVGADDDFFELGGSSLALAYVSRAIRDRLGHEVPLSAVFAAPTPRRLAAAVRGDVHDSGGSLVVLRAGDPGLRPIFMLFGVTGDVLVFLHLVKRLPGNRPVYGVRARGLDARAEPDRTLADMAESAIDTIRLAQASGPYLLLGYSFGGLVAYETARRLAATGESIERVFVLDTYLDAHVLPPLRRLRFELLERPRQWAVWLGDADLSRLGNLSRRFVRWLRRNQPAERADGPTTPLQDVVQGFCERENRRYTPGPLDADLVFVRAAVRQANKVEPVPVWRELVGTERLHVVPVPTDHFHVVSPPYVDQLVEKLTPYL